MNTEYVVLDFDGTLTRPEVVADAFLEQYRRQASEAAGPALEQEWERCAAFVKQFSPQLAWKRGGWEVCPAAPDPYILASCTCELAMERAGVLEKAGHLAFRFYSDSYAACPAPFREEGPEILRRILEKGLKVCFVSNASTEKLSRRLCDELPASIFNQLKLVGDAGKFLVRPATEGGPHRQKYEDLPDGKMVEGLARPVVPKRGLYFDALARLWGKDEDGPAKTIVCGDIWELDLALPEALGCRTHLIERAAPFGAYPYERARTSSSKDLWGLWEQLS